MVGPKRVNFSAVLLVLCVMSTGCTSEDNDVHPNRMPVDAGETLDSGLADATLPTPMDATPTDVLQREIGDRGLPDWGVTMDERDGLPDALRHRLDDELNFSHLQALGTHNSYHLEPEIQVPAWQYSHLPLDQQLGEQGVRQFELDVYYEPQERVFEVYHVYAIDQETTCDTLPTCLTTMKSWSDRHRAHHPLLILIEIKGPHSKDSHLNLLRDLESQILSIWPWDRLVHPDLLRGESDNLRDAIETNGWPKLSRLRGRSLFVLHTGGRLRALYTRDQTTTAGRVLFPDAYGDIDLPIAAYHSINGPIGGFDRIQRTVQAGHLVRTRADSDGEQARALDYRQFEAALESGAHFISTDFPYPGDEMQYGVTIPGGQPSRCNPLTGPMGCQSRDIEDPTIVSP